MDGYEYKPTKLKRNQVGPVSISRNWPSLNYPKELSGKTTTRSGAVLMVQYLETLPVVKTVDMYGSYQRFALKYVPSSAMDIIYTMTALEMREVRESNYTNTYRVVSAGSAGAVSDNLNYIENTLMEDKNYFSVYQVVPQWYYDEYISKHRQVRCHQCGTTNLLVDPNYREEYCCGNEGCRCRGLVQNPVLCMECKGSF